MSNFFRKVERFEKRNKGELKFQVKKAKIKEEKAKKKNNKEEKH